MSRIGSRKALIQGVQSSDGNTNYVDIIGMGDPFHSPHQAYGDPVMWASLSSHYIDIYDTLGIPIYHESTWLTCEHDSGVGFEGIIDSVTSTRLTDSDANFDTNNDKNSALNATSGMWVYDPNEANPVFYRINDNTCTDTYFDIDDAMDPYVSGWSVAVDLTSDFP